MKAFIVCLYTGFTPMMEAFSTTEQTKSKVQNYIMVFLTVT